MGSTLGPPAPGEELGEPPQRCRRSVEADGWDEVHALTTEAFRRPARARGR